MTALTTEAARLIAPQLNESPRLALVLGSGLGDVADAIEDPQRFSYADLPGFPASTVSSHSAELIIGRLGDASVAVLAGRAHYYEHGDASAMRAPLETVKALGCDAILLTNAAGSLREDLPPGSIMMIDDHINYSGLNPLIGDTGDARFVSMVDAYDPQLCDAMARAAEIEGVPLEAGVYMWFSGPSFETPAEIRMARRLGADAVGMSTVPDCILARRMGLRVAALSSITNYGAGMTGDALSHAETKREGAKIADRLTRLIRRFAQEFAS